MLTTGVVDIVDCYWYCLRTQVAPALDSPLSAAQILHLARLLVLLEYMVRNLYDAPGFLIDQVRRCHRDRRHGVGCGTGLYGDAVSLKMLSVGACGDRSAPKTTSRCFVSS